MVFFYNFFILSITRLAEVLNHQISSLCRSVHATKYLNIVREYKYPSYLFIYISIAIAIAIAVSVQAEWIPRINGIPWNHLGDMMWCDVMWIEWCVYPRGDTMEWVGALNLHIFGLKMPFQAAPFTIQI